VRITRSAAARSMRIEGGVIDEWCKTLAEEGWIKFDAEVEDPAIELSDSALERLRALERDFIEGALTEHAKEEKPKTKVKPAVVLNIADVLVFFSIILSYAMLRKFFYLPDDKTPLIYGLFLLAFGGLVSHQNRQYSVTKVIILSTSNFVKSAVKSFIRNLRHVISFALIVAVIYLAGEFIVSRKIYYLIGAIITFSMVPVIYQRKGNKLALIKLYAGFVLIIYALLLVAGLSSITELFARKIRVLDVAAGIILLIYLKMKESSFGLNVVSMKKFVGKKPSS
jgi:hypothetical protein